MKWRDAIVVGMAICRFLANPLFMLQWASAEVGLLARKLASTRGLASFDPHHLCVCSGCTSVCNATSGCYPPPPLQHWRASRRTTRSPASRRPRGWTRSTSACLRARMRPCRTEGPPRRRRSTAAATQLAPEAGAPPPPAVGTCLLLLLACPLPRHLFCAHSPPAKLLPAGELWRRLLFGFCPPREVSLSPRLSARHSCPNPAGGGEPFIVVPVDCLS